ncbi:hypothetical protein FGB62_43g08 [Gracilaria domingensis]|nr:hypothetical protein FGB62_43g08 [Gracilaria domingensis]
MRKAALRAMTGLVQTTGFIIKPYDAHRALLPRLVQLLTVETEQDVRLEAEILIGSLEAVNSENYNQERGKLRNYASFISGVQIVPSRTSHLPSSKLAALDIRRQFGLPITLHFSEVSNDDERMRMLALVQIVLVTPRYYQDK